jgi:uncharacterized membrane protein YwzB
MNNAWVTANIIIFSLLGAATLLLMIITNNKEKIQISNIISFLANSAPFLFVLFNIIYYIVIVSINFDNIVNNNVSYYLGLFMIISTILISIQTLCLAFSLVKRGLKDFNTNSYNYDNSITLLNWLAIFIGTINATVGITLGVIAKFQITQG